jgi:hypothetical protein
MASQARTPSVRASDVNERALGRNQGNCITRSPGSLTFDRSFDRGDDSEKRAKGQGPSRQNRDLVPSRLCPFGFRSLYAVVDTGSISS